MKTLFWKGFGLFLCMLFSVFSSAQNDKTDHLARHQTWLKLIKYEASSETATGWLSAIHADSFFLANNGKTNPLAELRATIKHFQSSDAELVDDEHPSCRFPARYIWLSRKLEGNVELAPMAKCAKYNDWIRNGDTHSISFVLATGYLENPASFYGHTILKMNSSQNRTSREIEDVSVNYGAIVPDEENPVSYIFKGIFGGYDAGFSDTDYYFHTHNYGETELRDIWEYELNLNKDEVDFLLAHSWEVIGKEYTYYFFRKNCGYRMAELLQLLPDIDIIPDNPLFVMPQVLIQRLNTITRNGVPLVKSVNRLRSRQSKLYDSYFSLSPNAQKIVSEIARAPEQLDGDEFNALSADSKTHILEVLINYYLFLQKKEPENTDNENHYRKVLSKRFALPAGRQLNKSPTKASPDKGRNPSRISVGFARNSDIEHSAVLHIRPAYYDEMDSEAAHVDNSSLSMAELQLAIYEDDIDIRKLDIVAISSFNSNATNLPGDEMDTWSMRFGLRAQRLDCIQCESLYFEGEKGKGFNINRKTKFILGAGGGIQDQRKSLGNLYGTVSGKLLSRLSEEITLKTQIQRRYFYDGRTPNDLKIAFKVRYKLTTNSDIRLSYESHHGNSISLDWGGYF